MKKQIPRRSFLKTALASSTIAISTQMKTSKTFSAEKLAPSYIIPDEPLTKEDFNALFEEAKRVYEGNRVNLRGYTFHMPSRDLYISMFAWDSGWHAITMTHIDPEIAASEIEFLLLQQLEDGRVPHETLFKEIKIKPSFKRAITMAFGKRQYDAQGRTGMMDPPSFMISAEKIFEKTNDKEWLKRILPRLEHCAHYLTHTRNLFGDGLVSIIHPWESGTDSSPAYDEALGLNFNTYLGAPKRGLLYPRMLDHFADIGWDLKQIAKENKFIFEDLTVNSITIRGLIAISRLNSALGNKEKAESYLAQAKKMAETICNLNWDDSKGCFFSRYDLNSPKLAKRNTCASILPILTGLIPKEKADRVIKEHLLNREKYWLDFVVPFNAKDELEKEKIFLEDLLLWRGHCIWINMNWMIVEGLLEYGYIEEAREITRRTAKMILHEGFREFYDFRNGQGKGATNFNWPGLILDMIKNTWKEL